MSNGDSSGQLERLIIQGFKNAEDVGGSPDAEYVAFLNPAEVKRSWDFEYAEENADGTTASSLVWKRIKPQKYNLKFPLDGTGATGTRIEVSEKLKELFEVVGFSGEAHEPHYLRLIWGELDLYCVVSKIDVTYSLFRPDGTPLRALVEATFTESIDDKTRVLQEDKSSPDRLHVREVKAGDTLPGLAYEFYRDATRYLQLAIANDLDDFRSLQVGTRLLFPPIDKEAR